MKIATDPTFKILTAEHLIAVLEHLSTLVVDEDKRIFGHLNQLDDISLQCCY